ncbi:hypothetical protein ARTHRO9V_200188 [Arthrobacter sp. 9V]|nr:hypothetical protein ARTHRO9V_200188 [Arthrobacter sp. 9V]
MSGAQAAFSYRISGLKNQRACASAGQEFEGYRDEPVMELEDAAVPGVWVDDQLTAGNPPEHVAGKH